PIPAPIGARLRLEERWPPGAQAPATMAWVMAWMMERVTLGMAGGAALGWHLRERQRRRRNARFGANHWRGIGVGWARRLVYAPRWCLLLQGALARGLAAGRDRPQQEPRNRSTAGDDARSETPDLGRGVRHDRARRALAAPVLQSRPARSATRRLG